MADDTKSPAAPPAPPAPRAAAPKPTKRVQITLIGKASHTVNGKNFEAGPTIYPNLGWTPEQWSEAKKDPHIVIEEVNDAGKVIVQRRDRQGKVVQPGEEGREIPKRPAAPPTDDKDEDE